MMHTPGPWIAESSVQGNHLDAGIGVIASNSPDKISNPSRGIVAWITRHVGQTNAEAIANAHLIAAAPDLLAALEYLISEWCDAELDDPLWNAACAAIAKAKGE